MTAEETHLKANFQAFLEKSHCAFIEKMILSLDSEPAFETTAVPFTFNYSFSVTLKTNKGNFEIQPVPTSEGMETFWIKEVEDVPEGSSVIAINSVFKSVH